VQFQIEVIYMVDGMASAKNAKSSNHFSLYKRTLSLGSSSFSSGKSCTMSFSFQNRFRTFPLESQVVFARKDVEEK